VVVVEASWPEETTLRLECRDGGGTRFPQRDLDLELYRSSSELNLMLSWSERARGTRALARASSGLWMDPMSGQRKAAPESNELEALGRRLRALLVS